METIVIGYVVVAVLIAWPVIFGIMYHWSRNLWLSSPGIAHLADRRVSRTGVAALTTACVLMWPIFVPVVYLLFDRARGGVFKQRIYQR